MGPAHRNLKKTGCILIYSHTFPPHGSGVGSYCYGLANGLARAGSSVVVLTVKYQKKTRASDSYPFKLIRFPRIGGWAERLIALVYFLFLISIYRPKQIFIVEKWAQEAASMLRLVLPFKYSLAVHGSEILVNQKRLELGFKSRLLARILSRFYDKAENVVAVSNYTKGLAIQGGIAPDKIVVLPNGIDIERFSRPAATEKLKYKLGLNGKDKIILTLAVLKPRKGQDMVIQALPRIIKENPDVKYVIAGCGDDKKRLEGLVNELHLENHVIFAGFIPEQEVIDYYDLADVFVMASRKDGLWVEGFGIPFIEANARGKPVIAGLHGAVPEVITDGESGLIIDPENPDEIAEAILKILTNTELAETIGQQGKEKCFSLYNWDEIAKQMITLTQKA